MKKLIFYMVISLFFGLNIFAQSKGRTQPASKAKTGIHSVDFRNFTYRTEFKSSSNIWGMSVDARTISLKKSRNVKKSNYAPGEYGSTLDYIKYIDLDGDGKEEAFIVIGTTKEAAGAYWEYDYFVFAYRNSKPIRIFHEYRYKGSGFRLAGKSLIIETPFWSENDGHCCPSLKEITTYSWRGNGITLTSQKFKPWS